MSSPVIGTFLRPVGTFPLCYCGRLTKVVGPIKGEWDDRAYTHFSFERWGLDRKSGEAVDDGLGHDSFFLYDLVQVASGVWRDADGSSWDLDPMYWREMPQRGQLSLF